MVHLTLTTRMQFFVELLHAFENFGFYYVCNVCFKISLVSPVFICLVESALKV